MVQCRNDNEGPMLKIDMATEIATVVQTKIQMPRHGSRLNRYEVS